jgi:hypothetical protein
MKYNLLLIANKPGVAMAMHNVEYETYEAAKEAVDTLRKGLAECSAFDLRYFITPKGEQDA